MRIGVISDTHDRLDRLTRALDGLASRKVAMIVHCGDWKTQKVFDLVAQYTQERSMALRGVLGNRDEDVGVMEASGKRATSDVKIMNGLLRERVGDAHLLVYHGHRNAELRRVLGEAREGFSIILLGHTHRPFIGYASHALVVNPGSLAFGVPRSRHWRPTCAVVDTDTRTAEILTID